MRDLVDDFNFLHQDVRQPVFVHEIVEHLCRATGRPLDETCLHVPSVQDSEAWVAQLKEWKLDKAAHPKRPGSAWNIFVSKRGPVLQEAEPQLSHQQRITKLSNEWKGLDTGGKTVYFEEAHAAAAAYKVRKSDYEKKKDETRAKGMFMAKKLAEAVAGFPRVEVENRARAAWRDLSQRDRLIWFEAARKKRELADGVGEGAVDGAAHGAAGAAAGAAAGGGGGGRGA